MDLLFKRSLERSLAALLLLFLMATQAKGLSIGCRS
jgi:hypothetical protein